MGKNAGKKANKVNKETDATASSCAAAETKPVASWTERLAALSPEEREAEERKQKQRDEKAAASAKNDQRQSANTEYWHKEQAKTQRSQHQEDKRWEQNLTKTLRKALSEHILESIVGDDGNYYVDLGGGLWKEVSGEYYCTLCEKHLNGYTLEAHMDSAAHKKKLAWIDPAAASICPPARAPPAQAPATGSWGGAQGSQGSWDAGITGPLEEWQEIGPDGGRRCKLCNKLIDCHHLESKDHLRRFEYWKDSKQDWSNHYAAPDLPYLAYLPYDESTPNGELGLRCLLCCKWVQDQSSHSGTRDNPAGSKEHSKNLRNYGPGDAWYEENVTRERLKWHPRGSSRAQAPTQQPQRSAAAAAPTPAPWASYTGAAAAAQAPVAASSQPAATSAAAAAAAPRPAVAPTLPEGWTAFEDEEGSTYYYHEASGTTQWEFPDVSSAAPSRPAVPTSVEVANLPPGWEALLDPDSKETYYYNKTNGECQWEVPKS